MVHGEEEKLKGFCIHAGSEIKLVRGISLAWNRSKYSLLGNLFKWLNGFNSVLILRGYKSEVSFNLTIVKCGLGTTLMDTN